MLIKRRFYRFLLILSAILLTSVATSLSFLFAIGPLSDLAAMLSSRITLFFFGGWPFRLVIITRIFAFMYFGIILIMGITITFILFGIRNYAGGRHIRYIPILLIMSSLSAYNLAHSYYSSYPDVQQLFNIALIFLGYKGASRIRHSNYDQRWSIFLKYTILFLLTVCVIELPLFFLVYSLLIRVNLLEEPETFNLMTVTIACIVTTLVAFYFKRLKHRVKSLFRVLIH